MQSLASRFRCTPINWAGVSAPPPDEPDSERAGSAGTAARALRMLAIAAALLALILGALAVSAWLSEDAPTLPFEYEGFD
jgi:hypothetical protein